MPIVIWNDSFSVGIERFDEHHRHLVDLLNMSYDGLLHDAPTEACSVLLNELFDYATYHFVTEEFWMSKCSYPEREPHIEEHNYFIQRLKELRNDCNQGKGAISMEIMTFLCAWLVEHILNSDASYGRFLSSQEISINPD